MEDKENVKGWVYVVVCNSEKNEHFLGLYDKERNVDFIPAFQTKDAASDCFLTLPKESGKQYEIQAVHIDELTVDAEKNGFIVAMVGSDGHIIR